MRGQEGDHLVLSPPSKTFLREQEKHRDLELPQSTNLEPRIWGLKHLDSLESRTKMELASRQ